MSEPAKGSFLGGLLSLAVIILVIGFIINIFKGDEDKQSDNSIVNINEYLASPYDEDSEEMKIARLVSDHIQSEFDVTDINKITVNKNLGTDDSDDYVLLIDLAWNRMNGVDTTKDMMRMYCDDLAAYTVKENSKVQEIALFWTIPYHKETGVSAKCSYEQRNGNMYLTDKMGLVGDK